MIADFFTKPLQGTLFTKLRDFIMNCAPSNDSTDSDHRSVLNNVCANMIHRAGGAFVGDSDCTMTCNGIETRCLSKSESLAKGKIARLLLANDHEGENRNKKKAVKLTLLNL